MFNRRRDYKTQLMEKSGEVAEVVADRLQDISRQAGKQAGAVQARVRRPSRRNRVLRTIGFILLAGSAVAAVIYMIRRYMNSYRVPEYHGSYPVETTAAGASDASTAPTQPGATGEMATRSSQAGEQSSSTSKPGWLTEGGGTMAFQHLVGKEVLDLNGNKLGETRGVYYRERADSPEWIIVRGGLMDAEDRPAPLEGASVGEEMRLACSEDMVKGAPTDLGDVLDVDTEMKLYAHYSLRRTLPDDMSPLDNDPLRRWVESDEGRRDERRSRDMRASRVRQLG